MEVIQKVYLADSVIQHIQKQISDGILKNGDMLPSGRRLALDLGVSRTVIRQALDQMVAKNIIAEKDGQYVIQDHTMETLLSAAIQKYSSSQECINEIIEVRNMLELYCVRRAANLAKPEDIREMKKSISLMRESLERGELGSQYDSNFHRAIVCMAGNRLIQEIFNVCSELVSEACKLADYQAMKNGLQITAPMEHQLVLDAIKERNEDKAAFELKEHLEYSARLLKGDFTPRKFGACKLRD